MIHFLQFVFLMLFVSSPMAAQKTIATLKPGSNRSKDFQIFNSGDTLFLSYFELDFKTEQYVHRAAYIFPNGVSENIFFKDIPLLAWCGFETVNGGFYHYYIEDRKKGTPVVKAFYLNRGQNARSFLGGEINIPEEIVGVIPSKGLTIITRNTIKPPPSKKVDLHPRPKGSFSHMPALT